MAHHHEHRHDLRAVHRGFDELEVWVLLAELERDVIALEADAGRNIPGASRPLTRAEWDAGVRFGVIDERTQALADRALAATDRLAEQTAAAMEAGLADAGSVADVQARTAVWASPLSAGLPPGITRADIDQATNGVQGVFAQAWDDGAADVRAEYEYQGAAGLPDTGPAIPPSMLLSLAGAALAVVTHRVTRMLGAAGDAARASAATTGPAVAREALQAARAVSVAGTRDLARQGVHQATSGARTAQATAPGMPAIKEIYASEILDGNTCVPCSAVDGARYLSVDEARVDYREGGGFRQCEGGLRCRGTLVFVHASESEPTLQTPGDVPPPASTPPNPDAPTGGGTPPNPPRVGRFDGDPTGPPDRPSYADLDTDGLIDADYGRLSADEAEIAAWQEQNQGRRIRSVRPRGDAFTSPNYVTPDVVDLDDRITFEYTSTSSPKAVRRRVRQERPQSPNLVLRVVSDRSPLQGEMGRALRDAHRRYSSQYESMTLLWKQPGGPLEQLPWRS